MLVEYSTCTRPLTCEIVCQGGGDMTQSPSRPRDHQQHLLAAYPRSLHSDADYFGVSVCACACVSFFFKTTYGQGEREREREKESERERERDRAPRDTAL